MNLVSNYSKLPLTFGLISGYEQTSARDRIYEPRAVLRMTQQTKQKIVIDDLLQKRQLSSDGLRRLASKMEIQRFVLSCLFQVTVIVMLFRCVVLSVVKAVESMATKIQQEFDVFCEYHADKNSLVWDEGHLFEGFIKGKDYIVCVQSRKKNNHFPLPVKTWKGFSVISASLSYEECSPKNIFLESQLSTYSSTRSEWKSRDFAPLGACEKELCQQITKDRMTDLKKAGALSGKEVHCKNTVEEITPVSASKRNHADTANASVGSGLVNPTVKMRRYANVAERKQGQVSERWSSRKDARRRKKKKFRKQRQFDANVERRSVQSSEAKIKPVSSSSFGLSKKRKAVQQEPVNVKKMISGKRPLPFASVNEHLFEETMNHKQEMLLSAYSVAELASLLEQLSISKSTDLADCGAEPSRVQQESAEDASDVSDYTDSDTDDDDDTDDAEYDLFPDLFIELKSLPISAEEAGDVFDYTDSDSDDDRYDAEYDFFPELKSLPVSAEEAGDGFDYTDSDSDDDPYDAEYDVFPELKSLPEQVLMIMQMLS